MHTSPYSMSAYAVVRKGCPIGFRVHDNAELEVTIGGRDQPLMLRFDADSLDVFLKEGTTAKQQMTPHEATTSDAKAD